MYLRYTLLESLTRIIDPDPAVGLYFYMYVELIIYGNTFILHTHFLIFCRAKHKSYIYISTTIMTGSSSPTAAAAAAPPFVITQTQTQGDVLNESAPSPEADESPADPRVDAALRERHLHLAGNFDAATQSRCSRLVTDFLRRRMKVERREGGDLAGPEILSPTDTRIDMTIDAAAAA